MKKRLFVAINLDPQARLAIARLAVSLPKYPGLVPTKSDNLHLTLLFIGDTDEEIIPAISNQLEEIAQNTPSLTLNFGQLGAFPDLSNPQVIWAGLDGQGLAELQQAISQRLLPIASTADTKPFRPHLTIARANSHLHPELTAKLLVQMSDQSLGLPSLTISQIHLMESTLAPGGSIYKQISAHTLQN